MPPLLTHAAPQQVRDDPGDVTPRGHGDALGVAIGLYARSSPLFVRFGPCYFELGSVAGEDVPIRIPPHQPVDGPSQAGKVEVDAGDRNDALRRQDERDHWPERHYHSVGFRREDRPPIVVVTQREGGSNWTVA
jgi:hypothetical protein